jgi:glycosyltransferase involved in cell wall biosynthesis
MINVLHLRSSRGTGGGPEKTILFSAREADPASFRLRIAYLKSRHDPEFDLDQRAKKLGINDFLTIDEDHKLDFGALTRLLQILREYRIDILHCHCYKSDLYGLLLRRFHAMKLVTTVHGPLASLRFFWSSQNWRVRYLYDQIDLRILRYFDHVLMVSDSMRPIVSKFGVKHSKLSWVKNAIDCSFFRRDPSRSFAFRDSLRIPRNAVVIGAVGRLNGEKDYPTFLKAAKKLLAERDDLYFIIAGNGPLEEALRKQAWQLGLADHVMFLGHLHDVRQVYEMMDVYTLSSTREGLPNTVLEAMAMGVPIVSTDVDGVGEAVRHQQEAFLVPPRDPDWLAKGIRAVMADVSLRERLTRSAREKAERDFSFARRMRHVESIYRRVMGQETMPLAVGARAQEVGVPSAAVG